MNKIYIISFFLCFIPFNTDYSAKPILKNQKEKESNPSDTNNDVVQKNQLAPISPDDQAKFIDMISSCILEILFKCFNKNSNKHGSIVLNSKNKNLIPDLFENKNEKIPNVVIDSNNIEQSAEVKSRLTQIIPQLPTSNINKWFEHSVGAIFDGQSKEFQEKQRYVFLSFFMLTNYMTRLMLTIVSSLFPGLNHEKFNEIFEGFDKKELSLDNKLFSSLKRSLGVYCSTVKVIRIETKDKNINKQVLYNGLKRIQDEYYKMEVSLAQQHGIAINDQDLKKRAYDSTGLSTVIYSVNTSTQRSNNTESIGIFQDSSLINPLHTTIHNYHLRELFSNINTQSISSMGQIRKDVCSFLDSSINIQQENENKYGTKNFYVLETVSKDKSSKIFYIFNRFNENNQKIGDYELLMKNYHKKSRELKSFNDKLELKKIFMFAVNELRSRIVYYISKSPSGEFFFTFNLAGMPPLTIPGLVIMEIVNSFSEAQVKAMQEQARKRQSGGV